MKVSQFVIGIDGGGTKTSAVIADLKGNVLARHAAGPSNIQIIGIEKASHIIFSLIRKCCDSAGCSPKSIHGTTAGIAGAGRPGDQKKIAQRLRTLASAKKFSLKRIQIESDARIALEGAFSGGAGIILIAGTGSIALAKDRGGNIYRTGGWGRILGDEGGGYFIGSEGLKAVCRHCDGRSGPTLLTDLIAKRFKLKTPADIITAIYEDNFNLALLAPIVFEAAELGDAPSVDIVNRASIELGEHVRTLVAKLQKGRTEPAEKRIPLSFIGGLIENDTILTRALRQQIVSLFPDVGVVAPAMPPVVGSVLMALA